MRLRFSGFLGDHVDAEELAQRHVDRLHAERTAGLDG